MGNTDGMNLYRFGPDVLVVAASRSSALAMLQSYFTEPVTLPNGCYTLEQYIEEVHRIEANPGDLIRMLVPGETVTIPFYAINANPLVADLWEMLARADRDSMMDLELTAKAAIALLGPGVADLSA